jgi:hypothetical protein
MNYHLIHQYPFISETIVYSGKKTLSRDKYPVVFLKILDIIQNTRLETFDKSTEVVTKTK